MNTVRSYVGASTLEYSTEVELTNKALTNRVEVLADICQALLDRLGKIEGKQLGVMAVMKTTGFGYIVYESMK